MIKIPDFKTRKEAHLYLRAMYRRGKPVSFFNDVQKSRNMITNTAIRSEFVKWANYYIKNGFEHGVRKPSKLYPGAPNIGPQYTLTDEDRQKRLEHEKQNASMHRVLSEKGEYHEFVKIIYTPMGGQNKK